MKERKDNVSSKLVQAILKHINRNQSNVNCGITCSVDECDEPSKHIVSFTEENNPIYQCDKCKNGTCTYALAGNISQKRLVK